MCTEWLVPFLFTGMITKTHREDPGLGLPDMKKKRKKKVVKEPETQYSILNSDGYFTEDCPSRAISPSKSAVQGQAPKIPSAKKQQQQKKGHGPVCVEPLDPKATARARRMEESPRPRKPALHPSETLGREKKKNRKSLLPPAVSPGSSVKRSPDPGPGREVTRVGKKLKKHKKEKRAQEAAAFSAQDPWFCQAPDGLHACSLGKPGQGQERKQRGPREHNVKPKKKKKTRREGDPRLDHPEPPRSAASSPSRKGSRKKPLKVEAADYIPIGDSPKAAAKKKVKSKNKAEQRGPEQPALKKKRRRSKEDSGATAPWEEVGAPREGDPARGEQGGTWEQRSLCTCAGVGSTASSCPTRQGEGFTIAGTGKVKSRLALPEGWAWPRRRGQGLGRSQG